MIRPGSHTSFHCHYAKDSVHTCNDGRIVGRGQNGLSGTLLLGFIPTS